MEQGAEAAELLAAMFSRLSSSRSPQDALCAFAGGALPHTLLSCCQRVLLGMFNTRSVLPLRVTCRDARAAVAGHAWEDRVTVIGGHLGGELLPAVSVDSDDELAALLGPCVPLAQRGAWRACFPRALSANVRGRMFRACDEPYRTGQLTGDDFAHLAGVRELDVTQQEPEPAQQRRAAFGAGLASLKATLHTLRAAHCGAVTNDVLEALGAGGVLRILDIECCRQVSGAVLLRLQGLQHLNITGVEGVSAAGLAGLGGTLEVFIAKWTALTDEAFTLHSWPRLHTLDISDCPHLTAAILPHICHVKSLKMDRLTGLTPASFELLRGVEELGETALLSLDGSAGDYLELLRAHPQSRGICTTACEAIWRCSSEDAEAVPLVVQALCNHAGASVRTLTAACKALAKLAATPAQCQREEALGALIGMLRQEGQPEVFYAEACRALWMLGSMMAVAPGPAAAAAAASAAASVAAAAALPHLPVCASASTQRLRSAAACALYASGLLAPGAEDKAPCATETFSVVNLTGSMLCHVCLPAEHTVGELKSLLCYFQDMAMSSHLRLICAGEPPREMEIEQTLGSYCLNGHRVHIIY